MSVGNVIIARLGLDSREFRDGLAAAQKQLSGLGAFQPLGALFTGAGVKNVLDYADHFQKLSERYHVNSTELQRLSQIAVQNESSTDAVGKALGRLERNQQLAIRGNTELQNTFASLNVTVEDLRTLSPEEILKKIGGSSMNAADLMKVLGKNALELRPTLKILADGTFEFSEAINAIDLKRLSEANDQLKRLGNEQKVFWAGVLSTAAEGAHVLRNDMRNVAQDTKSQWAAALDVIRGIAEGNVDKIRAAGGRLNAANVQAVKDLLSYRENAAGLSAPDVNINLAPRAAAVKSKAQLTAEQKERERSELALDVLAEKGPGIGDLNRASPQAVYNAQQARKVKELEGQAVDKLLYQADTGGAKDLLNMAKEIRQSITTLRESDKQVGAFKQAFKESLGGVEDKLDEISANTE